ncbi:hypothetical protein FA13DRAFT_1325247 [Coprinellus micaceus]|uniref:MYND-type domain-containing protein n=1 Tax=Coprinellus micaceus TaxID=71717 RepID=A0A4Y7SR94_COPMI|nr:hypothetical protein FA13DRAFT_1325247 [Coprinellus micaceus]
MAMGTYTTYPAVLAALFQNNDKEHLMTAAIKAPEVGAHWGTFWLRTVARVNILAEFRVVQGLVTFNICDNLSCDGSKRTSDDRSMQCGGCSSVVYCSQKCQSIDWKRRHRSECSQARKDHVEERDSGNRYSHYSRAFHVKIVEATYNGSKDKIREGVEGTLFHHTYIVAVDLTTIEGQVDVIGFEREYRGEWLSRPATMFPQDPDLLNRCRSLGREFGSGAMGQDYRLAEGVFPCGPYSEIYLPVLLKKVGDRFEAVYSIPRRGLREKPKQSTSEGS